MRQPPGSGRSGHGAARQTASDAGRADLNGGALDSLGLTYEHPEPGAYLVRLEGSTSSPR